MTRIITKAEAMSSSKWEELIRQFDQVVFLSLLGAGLRPRMARELCQDTWARLYEQWAMGKLDVLKLPGLAIVQARLLALEEHRHNARNASLDAEALAQPDPNPSLEERVHARQAADSISDALAECSPRAQALFELVMMHPEVPHRALAEQSGISVQRLRQTLCEVRARLRAALNDEPSPNAIRPEGDADHARH